MTKSQAIIPDPQFEIKQKIPARIVCDNFVAAFESGHYGAMYWLRAAVYVGKRPIPEGQIWYDCPSLLNQGGAIFEAGFDDPKGGSDEICSKRIDFMQIRKGLELMAIGPGEAFGRILKGDGDAGDADILLQYIILGEVAFG